MKSSSSSVRKISRSTQKNWNEERRDYPRSVSNGSTRTPGFTLEHSEIPKFRFLLPGETRILSKGLVLTGKGVWEAGKEGWEEAGGQIPRGKEEKREKWEQISALRFSRLDIQRRITHPTESRQQPGPAPPVPAGAFPEFPPQVWAFSMGFSHLGMLGAEKSPPEISTRETGAIPHPRIPSPGGCGARGMVGFDLGGLFQPPRFHGKIGALLSSQTPRNPEFSRGNRGLSCCR